MAVISEDEKRALAPNLAKMADMENMLDDGGVTIVLDLNPREQRKLVEHAAGAACFRMLVDAGVWKVAKRSGNCPAWQFGTLKDGRRVMWQPYSELNKLRRGPCQNAALYNDIRSRIIGDEVE